MSDLADLIASVVAPSGDGRTRDDLLAELKLALDQLVERGLLSLGDDANLSGDSLEIRVRQLLSGIGLGVRIGRPGLEDLVVDPPADAESQYPWVLEVKSSRKPQLQRDDLRQLDDWVFDLSQEGEARKHGLGGGLDPLALVTNGMITRRRHHPSPHKGVLVANTPLGAPFDMRTQSCLGPNDTEFVSARNFCILPLPQLLEWCACVSTGTVDLKDFWEAVHAVSGVLESPSHG